MPYTFLINGDAPTKSRSAAAELIGRVQVIVGSFASPMYSCPSRVGPLVDGDSATTGTVPGGTPSATGALVEQLAPINRALMTPPSATPSMSSSS